VCNVGVLWPNGWIDQDATWYGGRPRPRRHCVRWGHSSPVERAQQPPLFGPCLLCLNGHPHLSNCWALVSCCHLVVVSDSQYEGCNTQEAVGRSTTNEVKWTVSLVVISALNSLQRSDFVGYATGWESSLCKPLLEIGAFCPKILLGSGPIQRTTLQTLDWRTQTLFAHVILARIRPTVGLFLQEWRVQKVFAHVSQVFANTFPGTERSAVPLWLRQSDLQPLPL